MGIFKSADVAFILSHSPYTSMGYYAKEIQFLVDMDIHYQEVGQELLDNAYSVSGDRQVYNIYDGDVIVFQPDGTGGWHAYRAINTQTEVPAAVYRQMLEDGLISNADYRKLINNRWY